MTAYVALLRAVNVGGRNRVSMAEAAGGARGAGLEDVSTVLQSGNVLFVLVEGARPRSSKTRAGERWREVVRARRAPCSSARRRS